MVKIFIADAVAEDAKKQLAKLGELTFENTGDFEVVIVRSKTKVTKEFVDNAPKLKLVVRAGVGLDKVDLNYGKEKGITVRNTPKASSVSVAELALGLMLACARDITRATSSIKAGQWLKKEMPASTVLSADDCGALPYYSDFYTIDSRGLIDRHIARLPAVDFYLKYDVDYILKRQPDLIEIQIRSSALMRKNPKGPVGLDLPTYQFLFPLDYYARYAPWPGARALLRHPDFQKNYREKLIFKFPGICYVVLFGKLPSPLVL